MWDEMGYNRYTQSWLNPEPELCFDIDDELLVQLVYHNEMTGIYDELMEVGD